MPAVALCCERVQVTIELEQTIKRCKHASLSVGQARKAAAVERLPQRDHEAIPARACLTVPEIGQHTLDGALLAANDGKDGHRMADTSPGEEGGAPAFAAAPGTATDLQDRRDRALELRVEDAVAWQMDARDPERTLAGATYFFVLTDVTEHVVRVMNQMGRTELADVDRAFIAWRVANLVRPGPGASEAMIVPESEGSHDSESAQQPKRFLPLDRVVCRIDGERTWASGIVHAVNGYDAEQEPGSDRTCIHVMIDSPDSRLVAVHECDCHWQRAAKCAA